MENRFGNIFFDFFIHLLIRSGIFKTQIFAFENKDSLSSLFYKRDGYFSDDICIQR